MVETRMRSASPGGEPGSRSANSNEQGEMKGGSPRSGRGGKQRATGATSEGKPAEEHALPRIPTTVEQRFIATAAGRNAFVVVRLRLTSGSMTRQWRRSQR